MSALTFTVHSEPVGKGRHRTIRNGARAGHSYTPKRTTDAQNAIAAAFGAVAHPEGFNPLDGAVRLEVSARFAIPKSASKKRRAELMGTPCLKKPDGDNILKLVGDALNGLAYHDDAQVSDCHITKRWSFASSVTVTVGAL